MAFSKPNILIRTIVRLAAILVVMVSLVDSDHVIIEPFEDENEGAREVALIIVGETGTKAEDYQMFGFWCAVSVAITLSVYRLTISRFLPSTRRYLKVNYPAVAAMHLCPDHTAIRRSQ
ncbi:hypothetical protein PoB_004399800 [Plakobranchus ocellatus]|uniref:Uncharacterized protein n=1 Tax=Plakobranchus ocellatus TaxID=259542 RepID=A0AAV4BE86_9GAST|nr:hypothetical protein PoB_004399800 [Plakobranchus ocellatus]